MKKAINFFALVTIIFLSACSGDSNDDNPATDCETAIQNTANAQADFSDANELNYSERCQAYKAALQTQIEQCGDEDGSLQLAVDALGDCTQNTSGSMALMTANLDGVQYDNMKPNGFNFIGNAISVVTFSYANDFDYIKIQGNSTYSQVIPGNTTKEINLYIPENTWQEGTYYLDTYPVDDDNGNIVDPHLNIAFFYDNNDQGYTNETGGSITITEFDTVSRIITGSFEFEYVRINIDTDEQTGPYQCINGTFAYSLDDDYFD